MLHHQWSTEVGSFALRPLWHRRENRAWIVSPPDSRIAILETEKTAHCRKSSRGSATLTSYRARFLPVD